MFFFDAFGYIQATSVAFTLLALSAVLLRLPAEATPEELPETSDTRAIRAHDRYARAYSPAPG